MLSSNTLWRGVGDVGGLVPFFKTVVLYFAWTCGSGSGGEEREFGRRLMEPSVWIALAKCAPILSLVLFLTLRSHSTHDKGANRDPQARYSRLLRWGLCASAVGDAFLVWPEWFVWGMGAFAVAHFYYISAFNFSPLKPIMGLILYALSTFVCYWVRPSGLLGVLVPLYSLVLVTMCWRALARATHLKTRGSLWGALGAFTFLMSDTLLAVDAFHRQLPHARVLVMSTYYLAQLGIALSVNNTPIVKIN